MNKTVLSITILMIMSINLYAGGDITVLTPEVQVETAPSNNFLKTINGYVRLGYQRDNNDNADLALGGKLHIQTNNWYGLSAGASFYTTNHLGKHDGATIPFFDANNDSYSLLGEAYVQGQWGKTTLKVGRQEIDTPFADTDDIGMVPNTFEAAVFTNTDIADTTIVLMQVQKMSGVDSENAGEFNKLNESDGVQILGLSYEGIAHTTLTGWFYNVSGEGQISYFDASYEDETDAYTYGAIAQYVIQNYDKGEDSTIYGVAASFGVKHLGLTSTLAYNKTEGRAAENFFGGGPFLTNAEHNTLKEAGMDGNTLLLTLEWDATSAGLDGLNFVLNIDGHHGEKKNAHEYDLGVEYTLNDHTQFSAIYSDVDDNEDSFKNLRLFVNYTF